MTQAPATNEATSTFSTNVVPYDFLRSNRISQEHTNTVTTIHQRFVQAIEVNLSSMLRADLSVSLESVTQQTFAEYISSLVSPTCITAFEMHPLQGQGSLEINSSLVYPIVNKLLGGEGKAPPASRPFTDLELAVVQKVIKLMLNSLTHAWGPSLSIQFSLKEVHTNPALVKIMPNGEACLVTTVNMKMTDYKGSITICLPYNSLEPVTAKLGNDRWKTSQRGPQSEAIQESLKRHFQQIDLEVTATLGKLNVTMADLLSWQPGDILDLGQSARRPIEISIAGRPRFKGRPGLVGKNRGVTILNEISKE